VQVFGARIVSCGRKNKIEEGGGVGGGGWCSENSHRIAQGRVVILCTDIIVSKLANFAEHFKNFTPI
jgi:hypothetical protein